MHSIKTVLYFVQTISSTVIMLLILMEMYLCITVYEPKRINSNSQASFDDGTYRPKEYNNDDALYRYGYKVNSIVTGDVKQHSETRLKNEVKGTYSLIEPNGVTRLVQYIANANGFNAIVRYRFGEQYAQNLSKTNFNAQQVSPTNIFGENRRNNNSDGVTSKHNMVFDRFQQEKRKSQQITKFRQSFPKSISNQISIRAFDESSKNLQVLPNTTMPIPSSSSSTSSSLSSLIPTPSLTSPSPSSSSLWATLPPSSPNRIRGRLRQYEVIDPEVDIDIRRSIPKPFLNLTKLKQPRKN